VAKSWGKLGNKPGEIYPVCGIKSENCLHFAICGKVANVHLNKLHFQKMMLIGTGNEALTAVVLDLDDLVLTWNWIWIETIN
jgi:hypothetical protein